MIQPLRKRTAVLLAGLLPVVGFITSLSAAAGDLDTTFDGDGKVTTPIGASTDVAKALAVQTDGKLVAAGYTLTGSKYDFAVARYNTDGSLDTSFDGDGKATLSLGSGVYGEAVAVQPDGKIVVVGHVFIGSAYDFAVARYNIDGSLDTSFDSDGVVITSVGSNSEYPTAVAVQADGKLVVAGYASNGTKWNFAVVRYNANGSLDTSFDSDGIAVTSIGSATDSAQGLAVQADGKLVVVGSSSNGSNSDFAVVRYNANGSLDTSFDSDGIAVTSIGSGGHAANEIVVQADGKLVAAGHSHNGADLDFAVVRYNTNGSLDTSFDSDGIAVTPIGSTTDSGRGIAVQADGKLVAGGYSHNGANYDFAVVRYNTNGSLDTSFDSDGVAVTPIGSGHDIAYDLVVQADGRLVAAGYSYDGSKHNFAVVRYDASIPSTTTTSSSTTSTSTSTSTTTTSTTVVQSSTTTPAQVAPTTSTTQLNATTSTQVSVPSATTTSTVVASGSSGGGGGPSTASTVATTSPTSIVAPGSSLVVTESTVPSTTTTTRVDVGSNVEMTDEQSEELASVVDAQDGAAILVGGKPVETTTSTTDTTFSMSALGASLTVRCYDEAGADIPMSSDSRFELSPGDAIEMSVSGFKPGSNITATVYSEPVFLGDIQADQTGSGVQRWKVPDSLSAGLHTLVASGDLADVDDAVFGLRIVVDNVAILERIANSWVTRMLLVLAAFTALLIPARLRRREQETPQGQPGLTG